jgi:hypothetical protein
MKQILNICLLLLTSISLSAQTPQYFKGLGTSNSTFLFGYPTESRHSQCIFLNSDLQFAPAGSISTVYYRYGSTGQSTGNTLYNFRVFFKQTVDTSFTNTNEFFIGTVNALATDSLVIPPGTTGNWFPIQLSTPFDYNPALTLIVELRYDAVTEQVFGTYGTSNHGRKLISGDSTSLTGDITSLTWQDFGFDQLSVGVKEINNNEFTILVSPVPFSNMLNITTSKNILESTLDILDISGKVIYHREKLSGKYFTVNTEEFPPGIYFIRLNNNETITTRKVIKKD